MTKPVFAAAILKFRVFGGNHWSDIVVPAIFDFSTLKKPYTYKLVCFFPEVQGISEKLHLRRTCSRSTMSHIDNRWHAGSAGQNLLAALLPRINVIKNVLKCIYIV